MNKVYKIFLLIAIIFSLLSLGFSCFLSLQHTKLYLFPIPTPSPIPVIIKFEYSGRTGIDALTLLKSQTKVEQDASGLVVAIDNHHADSTKHEYWAFYINGQPATVGPTAYKTKTSDIIDWKIEKY